MSTAAMPTDNRRAFTPEFLTAINAAWAELLDRSGVAPEQAAFPLLAKRDILAALADDPSQAVVAGFFYRDLDGDGAFTPGEELTATLLGMPTLSGSDTEARCRPNCFWFESLVDGAEATIAYDVEGAERVEQTVSLSAGLNVVHLPVRPTKPLVYVVPHSHFDPEWRSTYQSYLIKELPFVIERIEVFRDHPEHVFNMDEECVLRPLIDRHPEIVDEFRQRILEGFYEPKGVVCAGELLMPLGESMIRQMTEGEQLLSRMLGIPIRPSSFWNVDNYGINLQLPQILAKAGRKYMNIGEYLRVEARPHEGRERQMGEIPHSDPRAWDHPEFWLEGLDGSKILVHRSNYGGEPHGAPFPLENILSHNSVFNHYGGDFAKVDRGLPGLLRELNDPAQAVKYDGETTGWGWQRLASPGGSCSFIMTTSEPFFRAVENDPDLPTIQTESRLAFWTGCYESRARSRQTSRSAECALFRAESMSTAAFIAGLPSSRDDLREPWYELLISHHHDPQLTVMGHYQIFEVIQRNIDAERAADRFSQRSADFLASQIRTLGRKGQPVVVFNPSAWSRSAMVTIDADDASRVIDHEGKAVAAQRVTDDAGNEKLTFLAADMPAGGWRTFFLRSRGAKAKTELKVSKTHLENAHVRVDLADGLIQSIVEKSSGKNVLAANDAAAVGEVFIWEDEGCIAQIRPVDFMDSATLLTQSSKAKRTVRVVAKGPARVTVEVAFELDWGMFRQRISLEAEASFVDFETFVDWRPAPEGGRRVRLAFPSAIKDAAVWRDIPFGVTPWRQSDEIQPINSWMGLSDADGTI
ncbi:MAG: glycoside hydrolase family 38 N-terminal domain-containing protein, partial [Planctomycetota bacterium]